MPPATITGSEREMWEGGAAAGWFLICANARPARKASQSAVLHNSARRGPTRRPIDGRSISQTDSNREARPPPAPAQDQAPPDSKLDGRPPATGPSRPSARGAGGQLRG